MYVNKCRAKPHLFCCQSARLSPVCYFPLDVLGTLDATIRLFYLPLYLGWLSLVWPYTYLCTILFFLLDSSWLPVPGPYTICTLGLVFTLLGEVSCRPCPVWTAMPSQLPRRTNPFGRGSIHSILFLP